MTLAKELGNIQEGIAADCLVDLFIKLILHSLLCHRVETVFLSHGNNIPQFDERTEKFPHLSRLRAGKDHAFLYPRDGRAPGIPLPFAVRRRNFKGGRRMPGRVEGFAVAGKVILTAKARHNRFASRASHRARKRSPSGTIRYDWDFPFFLFSAVVSVL